ncbi:MAG: YobA family protein [Clostridiales bacterium]|nr:YobA family protein [Clostridiales bacterium]
MKRFFCVFFALAILLSLTACGGETTDRVTFRATVLEADESGFLVEPVAGSAELNNSDRIVVPMTSMEASPEPEVGDTLEIVYNGDIAESYPAQISTVYSIRVVEEGDSEHEEA